jgi:hypothetical protein|tara:strand:- start:132 stop:539 length:408 start_codon:yes stop_codon:yes gene_type:complete
MYLKKNTTLGKANVVFCILIIFQLFSFSVYSEKDQINEKFAELNILDKVSSKTSSIKVKIGEEIIFQNLLINILKCQNSKFDDDPEVTAYMQVTDLKSTNNNKVYVFNDWTFASSPSIRPFDHPVYDIWLKKCYS